MTEIQLPPNIRALCQTCETICEKDCCGVAAFSFSPFNVIYHLTKWEGRIRNESAETLRMELSELRSEISAANPTSERLIFKELNAILTKAQALTLINEIETGIDDSCAIYASHAAQVTDRYKRLCRILGA